eukprot:TRINITY_DN2970_c0_g1_i2.p1 TRINITY_DN2970_c0_g1~~TRINITY_DN2970_c0_g1_i2.p1  ORF type:complete len:557 (-),score=109.26 TRINITY_DN2970_c0_g1_i2:265-1935(-)
MSEGDHASSADAASEHAASRPPDDASSGDARPRRTRPKITRKKSIKAWSQWRKKLKPEDANDDGELGCSGFLRTASSVIPRFSSAGDADLEGSSSDDEENGRGGGRNGNRGTGKRVRHKDRDAEQDAQNQWKNDAEGGGFIDEEQQRDGDDCDDDDEYYMCLNYSFLKPVKQLYKSAAMQYLLVPFDFVDGTMPLLSQHIDKSVKRHRRKRNALAMAQGTNGSLKALPMLIMYFVLSFVDSTLRGVAQVIFMNNPVTGLLILAALYIGDEWLGMLASVGVVCATAFACFFLGLSNPTVRGGLFGYNGLLVGAAFATFLDGNWNWAPTVCTVLTSMLSSIVTLAMGNILVPNYNIPPFTFPFNISTLLVLLGSYQWSHVDLLPTIAGALPVQVDTDITWDWGNNAEAILKGISQIYLVNDTWSGLVMLIGILFCSRVSAFFAVLGSVIGIAFAYMVGAPVAEVEDGLWGYNPVLGCMAIGGVFYVWNVKTTILAVFAGGTCALVFSALKTIMALWGLPSLTLAFSIGTTFFVAIQGSVRGVIPVKLTSVSTPEVGAM